MNQLKVHKQHSIRVLHEQGLSMREIARKLEIDRGTVSRYLASPPPNAAISPHGSTGRRSECEPFGEQILQWLKQGLKAQRIYQDLVSEHAFQGSYDSVKRFVQRLNQTTELPFRRMECDPREEAQVDFGQGAWTYVEGKRKRPHLFRIVLSHSRKAYSKDVWRQITDAFIRCLENAFRHFGGWSFVRSYLINASLVSSHRQGG
ncbi:MAG: helix-turn-helix domain-containing protein [Verrucomicrobiota bacterium]